MAASPAAMPASTKATITAGPASGTAWPSTKKMPVPIVAPTPNIVSWNVPIVRSSWGPCGCALSPTGLRRQSSPLSPGRTVEVLIRLRSQVSASGRPDHHWSVSLTVVPRLGDTPWDVSAGHVTEALPDAHPADGPHHSIPGRPDRL